MIHLGHGANLSAWGDATVALVLTSPPYFAQSMAPQLKTGIGPDEDLDALEAQVLDFAWSLRAVWLACTRVLAPDGRLIVQVRDLRLRERLVPLEHAHRQMLTGMGWALWGRHLWRPHHTTLARSRQALALSRRIGPLPFEPEVFMVFGRGTPQARPHRALSDADKELLSRDVMVTTTGTLPASHPHQAPLPVIGALLRAHAPPGGVVLDPFAGGGSTLVAAQREGMQAWGCDIDPAAVSLARRNLGLSSAPTARPGTAQREDA